MTKRSRISRHLRAAVQKLNDRGLHLASKWACEQLVGMDYEESSVDDDSARTSWKALSNDSEITDKEQDLLLFARSLLTNGEYQRCAHLLRRSTSSTNNGTEAHAHDSATSSSNAVITHAASKLLSNSSVKSCLGVFLSVYSMYMAGEKLKEQLQTTDNVNNGTIFPGMIGSGTSVNEKQSSDGQSGEAKTVKAISANMKNSNFDGDHKKNPFLYELYAELEPLYYDKQMDGFLLYIFAVIVRDLVRQGQIQGQGGALGLTLFPKHPIKNPMHPDTGRFQGLDDNSSSMGLSAYALFAESLQEYPWNWYDALLDCVFCIYAY